MYVHTTAYMHIVQPIHHLQLIMHNKTKIEMQFTLNEKNVSKW